MMKQKKEQSEWHKSSFTFPLKAICNRSIPVFHFSFQSPRNETNEWSGNIPSTIFHKLSPNPSLLTEKISLHFHTAQPIEFEDQN